MKNTQLDKNKILIERNTKGVSVHHDLLITDAHFDSPYCHRDLLKQHLNEAKKRGAGIFFNGDLFDVMGCYKDPRSKAADIRPEYIKKDVSYLDAVITDTYEFLKPYRDNIIGMGYGNHETSILKHRDTDPIKRLVYMLNVGGGNILTSGYKGYLFYKYSHNGSKIREVVLYHHHGYGGNANRSKGTLNIDIDSQEVPFADVVFTGHTHQKWYVPQISRKLKQNKEIVTFKQYHVKGGSYKCGYDKASGWEVEKGFRPTPIGGWWMETRMGGIGQNPIITIYEAQ